MYEPTHDTPLDTYFTPGADIHPFPVAWSEAHPSQTHTVIPTDWTMPVSVGSVASAGKADMQ